MSENENKSKHDKCRICGHKLSIYNTRGICFSAHIKKGLNKETNKFTSLCNYGQHRAIMDYEGAYTD